MKTVLVLLLIAAVCIGAMHGCDTPISLSGYTYDNASQYTAGSCTLKDDVRRIVVDWIAGEVTIRYHDENYISVTENASHTLGKDTVLRYWLDGDTLRIRYARSGWFSAVKLTMKNLVMYLPRDIILEDLTVETVSADVIVQEIFSDTFNLETVSGNIEAERVRFDTDFDAESVSGNISVYADESGSLLQAASTSGHIDITAAAALDSVSLATTSGNIYAALKEVAREGDLETLSGRIELRLPQSAQFTARISTLSGSLNSDFSYTKTDDVYICGSGRAKLDIETLSGSVSISADN